MSKKMKLKLNSFRVQSFITSDESEKIKGGDTGICGGGGDEVSLPSCVPRDCTRDSCDLATCGYDFDPWPDTLPPAYPD